MHTPTRRGFLHHTALGSLLCRFAAGWQGLLRAQQPAVPPATPRYDLVVKGGRVIDPAQNLSAPRDIAITGHRVARVATDIPATEARAVLDARGQLVTPGLIDIHTHVYDGVAPLGIPADPNCLAKGVTTAVDAGSAGAHTFPDFASTSSTWWTPASMRC